MAGALNGAPQQSEFGTRYAMIQRRLPIMNP
jgi:hypothetical protein